MTSRLLQTQRAFDAVAAGYDCSEETNELLLRLRHSTWRVLTDLFPPGSRLLDLGCGTGIDAVYLARQGRRILATDISNAMVERTLKRAATEGVASEIAGRAVAIDHLHLLSPERFDGIYSN